MKMKKIGPAATTTTTTVSAYHAVLGMCQTPKEYHITNVMQK